jgi:hypothetical protein
LRAGYSGPWGTRPCLPLLGKAGPKVRVRDTRKGEEVLGLDPAEGRSPERLRHPRATSPRLPGAGANTPSAGRLAAIGSAQVRLGTRPGPEQLGRKQKRAA